MTATPRSAIIFMDTETTGVHPTLDSIWEWAAIRREPDGIETRHHFFVEPSTPDRIEQLPPAFQADFRKRFDPANAVTREHLCAYVDELCHDRPHIIGAVPSFDTTRLSILHRLVSGHRNDDPWHYHLGDVENMAVGYLRAQQAAMIPPVGLGPAPTIQEMAEARDLSLLPPWDSKVLSRLLGVDPERFVTHTAMGDVEWVKAMWDAMF